MLYCPKCSAPGPFTQEGLSPLLVRLGYFICLNCMGIVKPVNVAPDVASNTEEHAEAQKE